MNEAELAAVIAYTSIIHTVAADPTSAMEWTVRTYTLESTPASAIPILTVDGYDNLEDSEG